VVQMIYSHIVVPFLPTEGQTVSISVTGPVVSCRQERIAMCIFLTKAARSSFVPKLGSKLQSLS
jgi:hypothetical protein